MLEFNLLDTLEKINNKSLKDGIITESAHTKILDKINLAREFNKTNTKKEEAIQNDNPQ